MTPETLKRIEWAGCDREGNGYCVVCGEPASSDEHAPDCQLKADLDASSGERPEIQVGDRIYVPLKDAWFTVHRRRTSCGFPESISDLSDGYIGIPDEYTTILERHGLVIWRRGGATS